MFGHFDNTFFVAKLLAEFGGVWQAETDVDYSQLKVKNMVPTTLQNSLSLTFPG